MAIVLRLSKGDTLTYAELDGNFSDLDTRVISLEANKSNWDEAYTWGNHAAQGYLTFYVETDPVFVASAAYDITTQNINNWSTAYNWGDHSSAGYLTSIATESIGDLLDVDLSNAPNVGNTLQWNGTAWVPSQSSGSETDPVFGVSPAATIDNTMISNWNEAYGWGDHSVVGYLDSNHPTANIIASNITNWNDAYSWGDHSVAGYLTSLGSIANHSDVSLAGVTDGFTLVWQTDKFVPQAQGGGTNVSISDNSPVNPVNGDMWWDSSDGVLKIYYNDGTSLQWVDAVPQGGGGGSGYSDASVATYLNGNLDTNIIPDTNDTYDIGSATNKIKDLYIGPNTLYFGDMTLSQTGTGASAQLVMPAMQLTGHLLPDTNATYDLGSAEYKIRHLYLSNNSLWLGDSVKMDLDDEGNARFKKRKRRAGHVPKVILDEAILAGIGADAAAVATHALAWFNAETGIGVTPNLEPDAVDLSDKRITIDLWYAYAVTHIPNFATTYPDPGFLFPAPDDPNYDEEEYEQINKIGQQGFLKAPIVIGDGSPITIPLKANLPYYVLKLPTAPIVIHVGEARPEEGAAFTINLYVEQGLTPQNVTDVQILNLEGNLLPANLRTSGTIEASSVNLMNIKGIFLGGAWNVINEII